MIHDRVSGTSQTAQAKGVMMMRGKRF